MHRALHSTIGLPNRSTSAFSMLLFLMPADVRRSLMCTLTNLLPRLHLVRNRSFPPGTIIPELAYADVVKASEWLCEAFGFRERLRIGTHRVQLGSGDGAVVAIEGGTGDESATHAVLVHVDDADAHHERAKRAGALILRPPAD